MCELTTALAIGSQVANFAGQAAQASAQNQANAQNRAYALADYNRQVAEAQSNYIAESRAVQQTAFDEELKKRDALASARAEAASKGAAGVSVDAVLNEIVGIGARTQSRLDDQQATNTRNYLNAVDTAYSNTLSRYSANQTVSGPSALGLAINIGSELNDGGFLG